MKNDFFLKRSSNELFFPFLIRAPVKELEDLVRALFDVFDTISVAKTQRSYFHWEAATLRWNAARNNSVTTAGFSSSLGL